MDGPRGCLQPAVEELIERGKGFYGVRELRGIDVVTIDEWTNLGSAGFSRHSPSVPARECSPFSKGMKGNPTQGIAISPTQPGLAIDSFLLYALGVTIEKFNGLRSHER